MPSFLVAFTGGGSALTKVTYNPVTTPDRRIQLAQVGLVLALGLHQKLIVHCARVFRNRGNPLVIAMTSFSAVTVTRVTIDYSHENTS